MFWTNFKRICKAGFVSFWRNGFVSLASVLIISVTLFVFGSILFLNTLLHTALSEIESRVDVNAYFIPQATEEAVLAMKKKLETLPEVAVVEYISRENALNNFKKRHENDEITLQALNELADNPFGAVLNIRAKETSQYENIAQFFKDEQSSGSDIIDKVNYYQNKEAIDSLTKITKGTRLLGAGITLVMSLVSIIIAFNTIRLAIYVARDEIAVMRLVGANNRYIRGPFTIAGIMYGVVGGIITLGLFYPATYWFSRVTGGFFGSMNLFVYYNTHFAEVFVLIMGSGVILGAVSSYLAVRKYLKI